MATARPPRIWISNDKPARGDIVRVRAQIEHRMESGLRHDAEGKVLPRLIVKRFEATLDGQPLFIWEPEITVSQNPYIEFTFKARSSGELRMAWTDDKGPVAQASRTIAVA